MSGDLTVNKILGAVLATGLAVVGLHEASSMAFEPSHAEKMGMMVEVAEETGGAAAPELPADWGTVLPVADIAAGEGVFAKCASCHKLDATNGTGPGLINAVGRKPAGHPGFAYSPAMVEYGATHPQWTYDELDAFLKKPTAHIPGTKMTFVGLRQQQDRINVIAYLRERAGGTLPIPAPDPSRQAPAPGADGAAPAPDANPEDAPVATGETAGGAQPAQTPSAGAAAQPSTVPNTNAQAEHK